MVRTKNTKKKKYFRGDSAFCNQDVIRACLKNHLIFTVTAHGNILLEEEVKKGIVTHRKLWEYTEEEKKISERIKIPLPVVEVSSYQYIPGWAPNIRFQVVIKRTWTDKWSRNSQTSGWKYYAVLTNWNLFYDNLKQY